MSIFKNKLIREKSEACLKKGLWGMGMCLRRLFKDTSVVEGCRCKRHVCCSLNSLDLDVTVTTQLESWFTALLKVPL